MKYRSRTEIIAMILRTAYKGATKMRIMYGAYLSYGQVKEYLEFLLRKNLLILERNTSMYRLTEKGLDYLTKFEQINEIMSVDHIAAMVVTKDAAAMP